MENIDRIRGEHALKISDVVTVLACRDVHPRRPVVAHHAETSEIIGGDRLFKPANIELGKNIAQLERLLARVGAIRIDK